MKAEIRRKLNQEQPKLKRRAYHRSVVYEQAKKPAHYLGSIADTQTKEELDARDLAAKIAVYRQQQRIAKAHVTSEKCSHKACPFLAVLDGECRRHALDRTADFSALPSQLAAARERADY